MFFYPFSLILTTCFSLSVSACLYFSGESVASNQHSVQCSWPAGPASSWQGMILITALFLPKPCQPTLSALRHPLLPFIQSVYWESPLLAWSKITQMQMPDIHQDQMSCKVFSSNLTLCVCFSIRFL